MAAHATETLNAGKVVPGYGHGVLRVTDPRFECFYAFGKKHCPDDPVFKTVVTVFETVPEVLMQVNAAVMGVVLNAADLASPELSYYSQYGYYSSSSQVRKD